MGSTTPDNDTTGSGHHWELFAVANDQTMANLLVTNSAFINSLSSHQVVVTDSDNTMVGGITSTTGNTDKVNNRTIGDVRIWAGETVSNGNLVDAPFTVTNQGVVTSQGNVNYGSGNVGVKTVMDNGAIIISTDTGNGGSYVPRAAFGFNSSGELVLKFYDASGNEIYDLGPGGLKWSATVSNPSWISSKSKTYSSSLSLTDGYTLASNELNDTSHDAYKDFFIDNTPSVYRFEDGTVKIGNVTYYMNPNGTDPDLLDNHSSMHEKFYKDVAALPVSSTSSIDLDTTKKYFVFNYYLSGNSVYENTSGGLMN
jgi:hypothetical protein